MMVEPLLIKEDISLINIIGLIMGIVSVILIQI